MILGIDPGSHITGFDVVRETAHGYEYVASGCIRTGSGPLRERLHVVSRSAREVTHTHGPTALNIEQVFTVRNADSTLKLGQTQGTVVVTAIEEGLSVAEYIASQVKQAIVGTGDADEQQVQMMVMRLLELTQRPQIGASDALAITLCRAHA